MIKSFADRETANLYSTGKSRKFSQAVCKMGIRKLDYLNAATGLKDLKTSEQRIVILVRPSLILHLLHYGGRFFGGLEGGFAPNGQDILREREGEGGAEWAFEGGVVGFFGKMLFVAVSAAPAFDVELDGHLPSLFTTYPKRAGSRLLC